MTYHLDLVLVDEFGRTVTSVSMNVDPFEAADRGLLGLTPPDELDGRTFESTVQVMKKRDARKGWLRDAMRCLGTKLAEHLEDKEGWHGAGRQALIEELERDNVHSAR